MMWQMIVALVVGLLLGYGLSSWIDDHSNDDDDTPYGGGRFGY